MQSSRYGSREEGEGRMGWSGKRHLDAHMMLSHAFLFFSSFPSSHSCKLNKQRGGESCTQTYVRSGDATNARFGLVHACVHTLSVSNVHIWGHKLHTAPSLSHTHTRCPSPSLSSTSSLIPHICRSPVGARTTICFNLCLREV